MEALRKAEEQKRKGEAEGQEDPSTGLALEPLHPPVAEAEAPAVTPPNAATGHTSLPELPSRLEDLDEQFMAHAAKPAPKPRAEPPAPPREVTPPPRAEDTQAARENARNLFEAKQPASNNRSFAITAGVLGLVGAIAIGGYFWWQLQPKGGLGAVRPLAATPAPPPPAPAAPVAAAPEPIAVAPAPTFAPPAAGQGDDRETDDIPAPPPPRPAPRPAEPAAPQPASPVRLAATVQKPDPLPEQAWQAFNNGELELARTAWQKVLANDPRNANALHGLAAVAQKRQQPDEAAEYYLRALEADPKDALALAALTTLRVPTDALQTESRLKTLLAEQPDSPWLNFALGNLYARGTRWAEAQQAYFRAHAADPANADYLFNLAVSLDQLRQPRLAIQYYQRALDASVAKPAGFDAAQVATRLKILQAGE
jgi:tetratricopeptide (TPR) repeat protein